MKKILLAFSLLQILLLSTSSVLAADPGQKIVRVGTYDNSPKIYKDESGDIKGFWADITNEIARKENWEVVYIHDSWDNNIAKLRTGEIDMMVDVAISEDRQKTFDFNRETVLNSWGVLYTRRGVAINSFMDLDGKKIAILESGILYNGTFGLKDVFTSFGIRPSKVVNVKEYGDVFELLDNGLADVGAVNWFYGISNEKQYKVNRTNIVFQPSELRYAFPKNSAKNTALINAIDADLQILKGDSDSAYFDAIGNNLAQFLPHIEKEVLPQWLWILFVIIGALIIIAFLMKRYQQILKRKIEEKTGEVLYKNAILEAQYETSVDGILLVDADGQKIISFNRQFQYMWGIPKEVIEDKDDAKVIKFVMSQVKNPEDFTAKIKHMYEFKSEKSYDKIELKDGRVFERYSSPLIDTNGTNHGRIWYFRDEKNLTEKFHA